MTERDNQDEGLFETETQAIGAYEKDNPTRRVIRWKMENTPVEIKTVEGEGELKII